MSATGKEPESMRLDRLLVFLRFARTRSMARAMIESGQIRLNAKRVTKTSREVAIGDVITLAFREEVCVAQIEELPQRRLSAKEAEGAWSRLS